MSYLRVVRDKRGYETTYLIQPVREGAREESRVLYVFRSPAGVRVGRNAFDANIRREIEAGNPGVSFDWDALNAGRQVIDAAAEPRRARRRPGDAAGGSREAGAVRRQESSPQPPRLLVPSVLQGDTPETRMRFLAHWHGILCEQLPQRVTDPVRREALMALTQKLNPAGWIDADEIAAGLEQAAEALEQLSRLLSKRRRKSRRGSRRETVPEGAGVAEMGAEDDAGLSRLEGSAAADGPERGLASAESPAEHASAEVGSAEEDAPPGDESEPA